MRMFVSSRKVNGVPNGEYIESDKFSVTAHGMDLEWQLCLYPAGTLQGWLK